MNKEQKVEQAASVVDKHTKNKLPFGLVFFDPEIIKILSDDKNKSENEDKEFHCSCGKLLAKQHADGKIYVWCKKCRKEIELEVKPYEQSGNKTDTFKTS